MNNTKMWLVNVGLAILLAALLTAIFKFSGF